MRTIARYILSTLAIAIALTACDNIGNDERLIYVKPAAVSRTVLIEDFTGQRCINCPNATLAIEQIIEQYGDSAVVAVGIHSGPFAKNPAGTMTLPLWTAEGDEYFNHWGVKEQPSGMVNRQTVNSNYTTWASQVYEQIQLVAPVSIKLDATLDETARTLTVNTQLLTVDGNVNGKLQLWLIEDSIVSPQYMPDGSGNPNYVHNHVFRQSINGTWGEDVSIVEGERAARQSSMAISDAYDINHLSIVAFVYNSTGVLQATKLKIKN